MSRYYLHLRGGTSEVQDIEGGEFVDVGAVRRTVLAAARELMAIAVVDGQLDLRIRIDAEDEQGRVAYSLPFASAVRIIQPRDGVAKRPR